MKKNLIKGTLLAFLILPFWKGESQAGVCANCTTYQTALETEFTKHENWMTDTWWGDNVEPALQKLTDSVRNAIVFETTAFGAFLDGQNQMGAMRSLQELSATTMKNYAVSDSICKFGTLSRSLALSQSRGKANQLALSERSQDRQLGRFNMASAGGAQDDRKARLKQFQSDFCDPADFGTGMAALCSGTPSDARQDIDINYTRAVDAKKTLNVNFTDSTVTDDEKDVIALANNLYAHKVFDNTAADKLSNENDTDFRSTFLDKRSIVAKRSVAENSFNAMIGDKAYGGQTSNAYFIEVLKKLGLTDVDADKYLGEFPSYDAQMEVLTKKLYQDPGFYANLMESPANVNRQYAALQSFGLMQKRDIFETVSRSEMLLSVLLEMEVGKYQDDIQNRQNTN